jgi:glycosyltransferase involved in cell wall biosynthesis
VHGQTGLLIEKEDYEGLATALAFLLGHPQVATQMGQAARRRVQEIFSWEQCVNAYDSLYQKLVKEWRSAGTP